MKRSIGMQSIFGFVLAVGATAAAPGCGQAEEPEVATESAALDQSAANGNSNANDLLQARCPHDVPAALNPPADATLAAAFPARGVQIYTCAVPAAGGAPAWTLKAPHALLGKGRDVQAIHFGGPSWEANDGSVVTAAKIASAAAPDATDIPWLLLQAATHTGAGLFADVTFIQRLATENGAAPATGCDDAHVGAETLASYGADYFFYRTAAAGERIRQCAAK
ncbi:MAG TPA: DUF3455 domain-containing protein [Polyangia bacterium]|jgi:hypothetical protein